MCSPSRASRWSSSPWCWARLQFFARLFYPELAPRGITTVVLLIMFFGSFTIFAISLIGEYIAKIFEEVKARPSFIRRHLIRGGEIRKAGGGG